MSSVRIFFDGSGGHLNTKPSDPRWKETKGSWAFVARGKGGAIVFSDSGIISPCNSPMAEMTAALRALQWAARQQYQHVHLIGDSKFVIDWLRGKDRTTILLHQAPLQFQISQLVSHEVVVAGARRKIRLLSTPQPGRVIVEPQYVRRGLNKLADRLTKTSLRAPAGLRS